GKVILSKVLSYPNPSTTGNTTLYYEIQGVTDSGTVQPEMLVQDPSATVHLKIYTIAERMVWSKNLTGQDTAAGSHNVAWNVKDSQGADLSNGVYYYVVTLKSKGGDGSKRTPILILR